MTFTTATLMTQTMRWFGPADPVRLVDIRQSGATAVVTALHEIANGVVWPRPAIAERKRVIEASGLSWAVVESLPVHERIKTRGADWDCLIEAYRQNLRNLAAEGIRVVTYNFMPLLDWTRTDLAWKLDDRALALRFEWAALAAYDIHILQRPDASADYDSSMCEAAAQRYRSMTDAERAELERTILAGLPGSEEGFTSASFLRAIDGYCGVGADDLRTSHYAFLRAVCPVADEVGIRLVVHPDDPPFPIFGLPRIVSTAEDLKRLFEAVPDAANGLCFCSGSFGARSDNELPAMIRAFGSRIGFLHLRSVRRDSERSFHETAHLEGDVPMSAIVTAIRDLSEAEQRSIPMRPDHGHQILDDLRRKTNPGYALLGRMRGLAELRGLEQGIASQLRMFRPSDQRFCS